MEREREGQFIFFHTFRETEREKERKREKIPGGLATAMSTGDSDGDCEGRGRGGEQSRSICDERRRGEMRSDLSVIGWPPGPSLAE